MLGNVWEWYQYWYELDDFSEFLKLVLKVLKEAEKGPADVVRGTSTPAASGPRTGSASRRTSGATTWVSGFSEFSPHRVCAQARTRHAMCAGGAGATGASEGRSIRDREYHCDTGTAYPEVRFPGLVPFTRGEQWMGRAEAPAEPL